MNANGKVSLLRFTLDRLDEEIELIIHNTSVFDDIPFFEEFKDRRRSRRR